MCGLLSQHGKRRKSMHLYMTVSGGVSKSITNPAWHAGGASLQMSTRDEQLDVLAKVLAAGEDEAGVEVADVTDDVTRTKKALAQRTAGSLAAMSGAHGLTYMEVCLSGFPGSCF